jgi:hypothetical protein
MDRPSIGSDGIFLIVTVGTKSIRTAERISRENAFFKTLSFIEFSVKFNKFFF